MNLLIFDRDLFATDGQITQIKNLGLHKVENDYWMQTDRIFRVFIIMGVWNLESDIC